MKRGKESGGENLKYWKVEVGGGVGIKKKKRLMKYQCKWRKKEKKKKTKFIKRKKS